MYYGKALSYEYIAMDIDSISHEALKVPTKRRTLNFRKIYRKAGIKRLCSNINKVTYDLLRDYLHRVVAKSIACMYTEKRKTLTLIHILYALK